MRLWRDLRGDAASLCESTSSDLLRKCVPIGRTQIDALDNTTLRPVIATVDGSRYMLDDTQNTEEAMDLIKEVLYSTVRLEVATPRGTSVGTAFFFLALQEGERGVPLLITNKHVVKEGSEASFSLHLADEDGTPSGASVPIRLKLGKVIQHPDESVDLCGISVGQMLVQARKQNRSIFFKTIAKEHFPPVGSSDDTRAVEEILMIGYPNGLWDTTNNMPIVRRGITATSPSVSFQGRPEFMIDAACFPGSSGSPVFLYERSAPLPRPDVLIGHRFCFLGVLYAGPVIGNAGRLEIAPIPTTSTGGVSTMMHLGLAIRAEEILQIEDEVKRSTVAAQRVGDG